MCLLREFVANAQQTAQHIGNFGLVSKEKPVGTSADGARALRMRRMTALDYNIVDVEMCENAKQPRNAGLHAAHS